MNCLVVKSDGKVYVNEFPAKPKHNGYYPAHPLVIEEYERECANALSTAIECANQEQAKSIIKAKFGHDLDLMTINTNGYQYPIPGLTFEVHFKPACVLGCQRSNNYCHPAEGCEASTQRVAILHYSNQANNSPLGGQKNETRKV